MKILSLVLGINSFSQQMLADLSADRQVVADKNGYND